MLFKNISIKSLFSQIQFSLGAKKLYFGNEARKKLFEGIHKVCETTQITLGPKGRNVALEYEVGLPKITKDGVTVAKNIVFAKRPQEMGAALLRRVSHSTNLYAGDGTTTSTIIANKIIQEGMSCITNKSNPFEIKKGMEIAKEKVLEFLNEIKQEVVSQKDLFNVANVSCNYNKNVAEIVSEAIWNIGINGIIEIEPGTKLENELLFMEGMTINRGYASPEFLINKSRLKLELERPFILIVNQEIRQSKNILPILEKIKSLNKPLLIFCQDISNEVLSNLLYNVHKGILEVCAITVPGKGDFVKNTMEDLALITGSHLFDECDIDTLSECTLEQLGKATKATISPLDTFLIGATGRTAEIQKKIEELKYIISKSDAPTTLQILKDRLSRLSGKMGVIMCGGFSQVEMYENREKIVDALNSTKSALINGFLPGGGVSLIYASKILDFLELENNDQNIGKKIFQEALKKPTEVLVNNASLNGRYIVHELLTKYNDYKIGFDLNSGEFTDLIEKGVIDCFHVVKTTLNDAVSIGGMVLTTEVIVANEKIYIPAPLSSYRKEFF